MGRRRTYRKFNFNATVVMKSPGIPDKAPIVKKLLEKGIAVISEIEFAPLHKSSIR
jgi:UDP-N-acetylmuramoylalanine--D-glutamate ligase